MSAAAAYNANVLLAAVTALSAAIAFVAALHLYARCLLWRRGAGGAGNPHALRRPRTPGGHELEVISVVACAQEGGGLDAKQLGALPVFTWGSSSPATAEAAAVQCAVCLGEMEDGELGRLLPACHHVFHAECIDTWLTVSSTCPVCRTAVGTEDEPPVTGVSPAS
ncbi:E3 ubiquitin-protein ligase ATL41 [Oryza brachyantha]|uniref:E3 ubiquitin-protein ligase ATL41 n=1 Tax=Oryza brachyantha TaxID=4533 RepID=UPI0003EA7D79|nr:E3 ubiquitin-protein ligase ATL41 [Oryza brachyantha]